MRVAVVDCGTNSVRLLVTDDGRVDVERTLTITRLGEGVDRDGRLGEHPMRRTVDAIAGYVERARELGAERIDVVATSAVRDAANRDAFLAAVAGAAGVNARVLSGDEEARAGFEGATIGVDFGYGEINEGPFLVVDIGGGSTEFVHGADAAERWVSVQLGSVRHTERHIAHDPPLEDEIVSLRKDARATIDEALASLGGQRIAVAPVGPGARLIGLAGTITTVAAIALDLEGYERERIHHACLTRSEIRKVRERLCEMNGAQRAELPAMPRGREDVIAAGVVILEEIMNACGAVVVIVSERDLLDGCALRLLAG